MIEKYNASSHGLYMTLSEDGRSFHGFICVHMNLFRPINIVAGTRPPSIYDVLQPEQTLERTLASFYLPRDTVKALHIDKWVTATPRSPRGGGGDLARMGMVVQDSSWLCPVWWCFAVCLVVGCVTWCCLAVVYTWYAMRQIVLC